MSLALVPISELDAVNEMLTSIGGSPLSSLEDIAELEDATIARQLLHNISRELQSEGWHFNTEPEENLVPDIVDGDIDLPGNTLGCDTTGTSCALNVTIRGTKLYDLENHTFDFSAYTSGIEVELIVFLEWTDLPEYARRYIYIRAGRKFQKKMLASTELESMTEEDEIRAFANFKNRESQNADHNILTNTQVQATWFRI